LPLNIISNFSANVAHRNLTSSDMQATNSLAKLSAGTRVLGAKDDAAALAVGSRLGAEIAGLKTAAVNAGQAISMLQVADGAMSQVNDVLVRMKSLASPPAPISCRRSNAPCSIPSTRRCCRKSTVSRPIPTSPAPS
jgi:flagellin